MSTISKLFYILVSLLPELFSLLELHFASRMGVTFSTNTFSNMFQMSACLAEVLEHLFLNTTVQVVLFATTNVRASIEFRYNGVDQLGCVQC